MDESAFILHRCTATLLVGGSPQVVGTLRQFFKLTELDEETRQSLQHSHRWANAGYRVSLNFGFGAKSCPWRLSRVPIMADA